jgi:hypothetical protein
MDTEKYYDIESSTSIMDITRIYDTQLIINNETVEYFIGIVDAKELITYEVRDYSWNRDLDQDHVKKIYKDLNKMENPHLIGTIKIIHNKRFQENYIFDGQHRKEAIFKRLSDCKYDDVKQWKMNVTLEIYSIDCKTIEESKTAEHLFKMANKVRAFDVKTDTINKYIQTICKQFEEDSFFKLFVNKGVNKSIVKIFPKDLFNNLTLHFKINKRVPVADVIKMFKEKNYNISLLQIDELNPNYKYMNQKNKEECRQKFIKAKQKNFCLNLEWYPPSKWIQEIVEKINNN